jgi:hypothetical protein
VKQSVASTEFGSAAAFSREGSYVLNGDFGGTLDVSTFLSSFLAFFTAFFSFLLAFAVPLLSWTFDAVLHRPSSQRGRCGV